MAFRIVTFLWPLLLFPRYGLTNLDAIRPNDSWSDEILLTVMATAGLSVAGLGYAQLAVSVLATLSMVAVGLVIFWRKADSWFGLYVGVLFVWFGTQANLVTDPVGQRRRRPRYAGLSCGDPTDCRYAFTACRVPCRTRCNRSV